MKHGQELEALVTALQAAQEQRQALEREIVMLDATAGPGVADRERLRAALSSRAADIWGVLVRREPEGRRVLQALFADRLQFAPFNEGLTRGYQFFGTGTYGGPKAPPPCI